MNNKEDAHAWVNRVHEHKEPYFHEAKMLTQITSGPYWWPTIHIDTNQITNECMICKPKTMKIPNNIDGRAIILKE